MTDSETPKFSRRRRAVLGSAIATGICVLLADAAGLRTSVRESLSEIGISPPVANLAYFVGGALCFGIIFLLVAMWLTSREVMAESRRSWWRRKRVIGAIVCWIVVAYPLSYLVYVYLNSRNVLTPSAQISASYFFAPLKALVFRPTGGTRLGCGWYQDALRYAYRLGEQHGGNAAPVPVLPPQQGSRTSQTL